MNSIFDKVTWRAILRLTGLAHDYLFKKFVQTYNFLNF